MNGKKLLLHRRDLHAAWSPACASTLCIPLAIIPGSSQTSGVLCRLSRDRSLVSPGHVASMVSSGFDKVAGGPAPPPGGPPGPSRRGAPPPPPRWKKGSERAPPPPPPQEGGRGG